MVICIMTRGRQVVLYFFCIFIANFVKLTHCNAETEGETLLEEFLICRSCGSDAALSNFLVSKESPKALISQPVTLFGGKEVLVQILENPLGAHFEVVVLKRATCARIGIWNTSYSWYPGYAWKLCLCPKCAAHLGWMFEPVESATKDQAFPSEKGFYVLVLDSLIAETDLKSLFITGYSRRKD